MSVQHHRFLGSLLVILSAWSAACDTDVSATRGAGHEEVARVWETCGEDEHHVLASTLHDVIAYCVSDQAGALSDRMTEVASCMSLTTDDNQRILDISWPFSLSDGSAAAIIGNGSGGQIRAFAVPDGESCCSLGTALPEYLASGAPQGCGYGPTGPVGLAAGNGLQFVNSMNTWPIDLSIRPTGQEGNGITSCPMTTHLRHDPSHPTPIAMSRDIAIFQNIAYAVVTAPAGVKGPNAETYISQLGISGDGKHEENANISDLWVMGGNKWGPFLPAWVNPDHVAGMAVVPTSSGSLGEVLLFLTPAVTTGVESACGAGTWDVVSVSSSGLQCASKAPAGTEWGGATHAE